MSSPISVAHGQRRTSSATSAGWVVRPCLMECPTRRLATLRRHLPGSVSGPPGSASSIRSPAAAWRSTRAPVIPPGRARRRPVDWRSGRRVGDDPGSDRAGRRPDPQRLGGVMPPSATRLVSLHDPARPIAKGRLGQAGGVRLQGPRSLTTTTGSCSTTACTRATRPTGRCWSRPSAGSDPAGSGGASGDRRPRLRQLFHGTFRCNPPGALGA